MRKLALATIAALTLATTAHAGPTSRRVWLMCYSEDPSCAPLLETALEELRADPRWEGQVCHVPDHVDINRLYHLFMRSMYPGQNYSEAPPRIGVYIALNDGGLCS